MDSDRLLSCCLYFTANTLARAITRLGEECFKPLGLSPSQAFLIMLALENPGISSGELAACLNLAPSTVTRLADAMVARGLVERRTQGKSASIHPTEQAKELAPKIAAAWKSLHRAYSDVLGEQAGQELTQSIHKASKKLGER